MTHTSPGRAPRASCTAVPTSVRYSGASLGYQIGAILGGGIAPMVAAALYARWRSSVPITLYLGAVSLLGLACIAVVTRPPAARA